MSKVENLSVQDKMVELIKYDVAYVCQGTENKRVSMNAKGDYIIIESESPITSRLASENEIQDLCEAEKENIEKEYASLPDNEFNRTK
jgi:hypothetical protein